MNKLDDAPQYMLDNDYINISTTSVFSVQSTSYVPVNPISGAFLLLDNSNFLLLDGTNLLLL